MFIIKVPKTLSDDSQFHQYLLSLVINGVSAGSSDDEYVLMQDAVNKYLKSSVDHPPTCRSILSYYVRTFKIRSENDHTIIGDFSCRERVVGTTDKTLYEVVRLMEYGIDRYPPVPKLTKVISHIQRNLSTIYKDWLRLIKQ